jgi:hypothetical protein
MMCAVAVASSDFARPGVGTPPGKLRHSADFWRVGGCLL